MRLKQLVILGVLVFLNGFIFTVLLLMVSREMARPAATPTQLSTATPTIEPTHTATPPVSTSTSMPLATSTSATQPTATNTMVVVQPSPTQTTAPSVPTATFTPGAPTSTVVPPTSTSALPTATQASQPTATTVPSTATATTQPTATPGSSWDFEYVSGSVVTSPNCAGPYFRGVILGQGGARTNGISVHFWFYDVHDCKVSGEGESTGEWGFNPGLAEDLKNTDIEFYVQVVDNCTNLGPRSEVLTIPFDNACAAGQFENITFRYTR